jgi:hypothetical protein
LRTRTSVRAARIFCRRLGGVAASAVFGALPYTGNNNAVDFWRGY